MITQSEVIEIGKIGRPHGKAGEVQCSMFNELWDDADATFLILEIDAILVPFRVTEWRGKGADTLIFRLNGIDTEQKASRLTGLKAYMLRRDCTEGGEEEMLTWQDLIGYQVFGPAKNLLGTLVRVDESTANTLGELDNGKLIPLHEDLILALVEETKTLQVNYETV